MEELSLCFFPEVETKNMENELRLPTSLIYLDERNLTFPRKELIPLLRSVDQEVRPRILNRQQLAQGSIKVSALVRTA